MNYLKNYKLPEQLINHSIINNQMKQFLVFIAILLYCNLYAQDFNVEEYIQKGIDAFGNAQYEEAINYLRPCEEFYSQFSDSVSKSNDAELLSMEATVYGSLGDYKKAIDCETKSSIILNNLSVSFLLLLHLHHIVHLRKISYLSFALDPILHKLKLNNLNRLHHQLFQLNQ